MSLKVKIAKYLTKKRNEIKERLQLLPQKIDSLMDLVNNEIDMALYELEEFELVGSDYAGKIRDSIDSKKGIIGYCIKYQAIGSLLTAVNIATPVILGYYIYDTYKEYRLNKESRACKFNLHPLTIAATVPGGSYGYIFSAFAILFNEEEKKLIKFTVYRNIINRFNRISKEKHIFNYAFELFGKKEELKTNSNLANYYYFIHRG